MIESVFIRQPTEKNMEKQTMNFTYNSFISWKHTTVLLFHYIYLTV